MGQTEKRSPSLDLLRCFCFLLVVSAHALYMNNFYFYPVQGMKVYLLICLRSACMSIVPIYLMLSGYFLKNRTATKKYYSKIWKTIILYVLSVGACIVYRLINPDLSFSLFRELLSIIDFSGAPYGWYVEMYLGLFLLIPFLNLIYNHIELKAHKQLFIGILLLLTAAPAVINTFRFDSLSWWKNPSSSQEYHKLIGTQWTRLYPLASYYIGCYLREYPLKLSKTKTLLLLIIWTLLIGGYNYYRSYGVDFIWGEWSEMWSLLSVVEGVLIFSLFQKIDLSKIGRKMQICFSKLSEYCFSAFLVSWIFEVHFYSKFKAAGWDAMNATWRLLYLVPLVYISSMILAAILTEAYRITAGQIQKLRTQRKEKLNQSANA